MKRACEDPGYPLLGRELSGVPPVEADVFEELMDDDTAFFEEMALLSIGRDD